MAILADILITPMGSAMLMSAMGGKRTFLLLLAA
jgi:hypothetical protein